MTARDRLLKILFDDPTRKHIDIKFFRGLAEKVDEEELCGEVSASLFEFNNGLLKATDGMPEDSTQVDVRNLALPK